MWELKGLDSEVQDNSGQENFKDEMTEGADALNELRIKRTKLECEQWDLNGHKISYNFDGKIRFK